MAEPCPRHYIDQHAQRAVDDFEFIVVVAHDVHSAGAQALAAIGCEGECGAEGRAVFAREGYGDVHRAGGAVNGGLGQVERCRLRSAAGEADCAGRIEVGVVGVEAQGGAAVVVEVSCLIDSGVAGGELVIAGVVACEGYAGEGVAAVLELLADGDLHLGEGAEHIDVVELVAVARGEVERGGLHAIHGYLLQSGRRGEAVAEAGDGVGGKRLVYEAAIYRVVAAAVGKHGHLGVGEGVAREVEGADIEAAQNPVLSGAAADGRGGNLRRRGHKVPVVVIQEDVERVYVDVVLHGVGLRTVVVSPVGIGARGGRGAAHVDVEHEPHDLVVGGVGGRVAATRSEGKQGCEEAEGAEATAEGSGHGSHGGAAGRNRRGGEPLLVAPWHGCQDAVVVCEDAHRFDSLCLYSFLFVSKV